MHESILLFVGPGSGIQDKRRSDPDPVYQKMVGSGSWINIPDPQHWYKVMVIKTLPSKNVTKTSSLR
jgi:hypothetical protein